MSDFCLLDDDGAVLADEGRVEVEDDVDEEDQVHDRVHDLKEIKKVFACRKSCLARAIADWAFGPIGLIGLVGRACLEGDVLVAEAPLDGQVVGDHDHGVEREAQYDPIPSDLEQTIENINQKCGVTGTQRKSCSSKTIVLSQHIFVANTLAFVKLV